jgi:quercetin dioxygenase-like cupin family protein
MKRKLNQVLFVLTLGLTVLASADTKKELVTTTMRAPAYVNPAGNFEERMLIRKENTGDPSFYMGRGIFQPGAEVPEHVHSNELEAVYVISGTGKVTIGKQSYDIGPGSAVYVPPNTPHSFTNNGKEPVEVIHMYSPGGPEERFKSWKRL